MNRTIRAGFFLIIIALAVPAIAQQERAPRVIKETESYIVRGRLIGISGDRVEIKAGRGERLSFDIDHQTDVYEEGGLISIATMDEVKLSPDALRAGNIIEIVVERDGSRRIARIITRLASLPGHVARNR